MPQYKNILIALDGQMAPRAMECVQEIFRTIFKKNEDKLQVGRLDFVDSKEDIEQRINGASYDVLLCTERIRGVNIGNGSIKQWKKKNHLLDIILFIDAAKKGGEKVRSLHSDGYYNAIYSTDLQKRSHLIIDLILASRTVDEAAEYYGLVEQPILTEGVSENIFAKPGEVQDMEQREVVSDTVINNEIASAVNDEKVEERPIQSVLNEVLEEPVVVEPTVIKEVEQEPVADYWIPEKPEDLSVEETTDEYVEGDSVEESYVSYQPVANEVSVIRRNPLDPSCFGGEPVVMIKARIGSVVSDNVMVIECPNGGLMQNKKLIENRVITLLL